MINDGSCQQHARPTPHGMLHLRLCWSCQPTSRATLCFHFPTLIPLPRRLSVGRCARRRSGHSCCRKIKPKRPLCSHNAHRVVRRINPSKPLRTWLISSTLRFNLRAQLVHNTRHIGIVCHISRPENTTALFYSRIAGTSRLSRWSWSCKLQRFPMGSDLANLEVSEVSKEGGQEGLKWLKSLRLSGSGHSWKFGARRWRKCNWRWVRGQLSRADGQDLFSEITVFFSNQKVSMFFFEVLRLARELQR